MLLTEFLLKHDTELWIYMISTLMFMESQGFREKKKPYQKLLCI